MVGRGVGTELSPGMWLVGVLVLYFPREMGGRGVGTVFSPGIRLVGVLVLYYPQVCG